MPRDQMSQEEFLWDEANAHPLHTIVKERC